MHKHCGAVNTHYSYYTMEVNWISLLKEYADSKGCQVVYTVETTGLTRRPMHAVTAYFDSDVDRTAVGIGTTIKKAKRQASKTLYALLQQKTCNVHTTECQESECVQDSERKEDSDSEQKEDNRSERKKDNKSERK